MLLLLLACASPCGERTPLSLSGGGGALPLCADRATTARQRRAGLSAKPPLEAGEALLIDFPVTDRICITTEPMAYPIDVYFIAEDARVLAAGCRRGPEAPLLCQPETRRVLETLPQSDCADRIGATLSGL